MHPGYLPLTQLALFELRLGLHGSFLALKHPKVFRVPLALLVGAPWTSVCPHYSLCVHDDAHVDLRVLHRRGLPAPKGCRVGSPVRG